MKTNNELKIAAIVGILMTLICVIVLMVQNNKKNEIVELNAYKHFYNEEEGEDDRDGYYSECYLTTEDKINIESDLRKVNHLSEDSKVNQVIIGNYKIIINDEFYAFDNAEDNIIYSGKEGKMYKFSSDIYQTIIDRCEG